MSATDSRLLPWLSCSSPVRTLAREATGMRMLWAAAMAAVMGMGCAGLPNATQDDVAFAQAQFPGATHDTLEQGRSVYAARCSGCHPLHLPSEKSPGEWVKLLPEMEDNARMKQQERDLVQAYLVTMSARSAATARATAASRAGTGGSGIPAR